MKTVIYVAAALLTLTFAQSAASQDAMKGMSPMAGAEIKIGKGVGVIRAIDPNAGTVVIQHGPIPALGWPAMTMTFRATPKYILNGLKVGEKIGFDIKVRGMSADVTAVQKQ